jgi:hypothetical protein
MSATRGSTRLWTSGEENRLSEMLEPGKTNSTARDLPSTADFNASTENVHFSISPVPEAAGDGEIRLIEEAKR